MAWRGKQRPDKTIDKPYFYHPENFTDAERLSFGRLAIQAHREAQERERPAMNRMVFARYLADMGYINEGFIGNGIELVEGYEPDIIIKGDE